MGLKIGTLREIGAKKGDVVTFDQESEYRFTVGRVEGYTVYGYTVDGDRSYDDSWSLDGARNWRIVSTDAPTGPVRTVTRKEVVRGEYGRVVVTSAGGTWMRDCFTADELRVSIATLTEIADALEEE